MAGTGGRETGGCLVAVPPQPPDIAAEGLDEHHEGDGQQDSAHRERRNLRSRDHQRDPLRRGHRLAPVAPRQRGPQPRQRPSRREERVARKTDQEHPAADRRGDLDAEHEDEERVDLAVQLRAERRLRIRAPREPAVDEVERERDGCERHQRRGRDGPLERGRGQSRDSHRERRARQRHPAGPAEPRRRVAPKSTRERQVQGQSAGETDEPAGAADPYRPRKHGQEQECAAEAGQRAELFAEIGQRPLARPQRCSPSQHPKDTTVPDMRRFVERP